MKTVLLWTLALFILAAPVLAEATTVSIKVTQLKNGVTTTAPTVAPTVTFTDNAGKPAVALACTSNAPPPATNTTAGTALCSRTILIGTTLAVTIRDISTTNRARVYRDDGQSSDILNVAGITATTGPAATGATLTLTISYSSNEFTKLNYNSYSYTAATSGNYFSSTGGTPSACTTGTPMPPPCVTLKLTANNVTVNQFGDSAVATVNVPPIGGGGAFGPTANPSETKSIPCGTSGVALSCTPSLQGELQAISKAASDTLKIVGGAAVAGSHRSTAAGGVTDTFVDVSVPETQNTPATFVLYDQSKLLQAELAQNNLLFPKIGSGEVPLDWINLKRADPNAPVDTSVPTQLKSIVTNADLFDDGAYVSWVPTNLKSIQPRDLTSLIATFDSYVGCPGPNAASPSQFFFVEIQLKTVPIQFIKVLLDCGASSNQNLVNSTNVVTLPDGSTTNWKGMLSKFGGVDIRAISVRLAPITTPSPVDQTVNLESLTIVAFKTTFTRSGSQESNFVDLDCVNDFPGLNEFTVRATPIDAAGVPVGSPFIWPGPFTKTQSTSGACQVSTSIPINQFPPKDRQNAWQFELLYDAVPSGSGKVFVSNNN